MKVLRRFLAFLLATAVTIAAWAWVIAHTIADPAYVQRVAASSELSANLAAHVPGADPAVVQQQIDGILTGIINYVTAGGPAPTLNLPGVTQTPIVLAPDAHISGVVDLLKPIGQLAPIAVVVLLVLVLVLSGHNRLRVVTGAAFSSAVGLALSGAVLWLAPSLLLSRLPADTDLLGIKEAFAPFITELLHGMALQFGIIAVGLVAAAAVLMVLHAVLRLAGRLRKPHTAPTAPDPALSGRRPGDTIS